MTDRPIDVAAIEAAERVTGVAYTAAERAQMARTIAPQIAAAVARRAVRLDNAAPPASRFDPRLPGFAMPPAGAQRGGGRDAGPLPGDDAAIAFAPLWRLSAWLGSGALSSRRLTEIYLSRIAALGPKLECFAAVTAERALAEADAMDALTRAGVSLGPLHGAPYGLKDLFDARGVATGWGAEPFSGRVAEADAAVVRRLRAAGAVLIGKTAVGALAYGDIWDGGIVRNPWNLEEGARGSSAGSGAATAAGLAAFCIGTETLGSIVAPSERCGATGLRPTFGRVSRAGGMTLAASLDKVGPICRSVEDAALVLAALNGGDAADRGSIDAPLSFDLTAGVAGLRVGWLPQAYGDGALPLDRAVRDALGALGVELVEVGLPDLPYASLTNMLFAEAAAWFEALTLEDRDDALRWQDDGAWPETFRRARFLSAVDHVQLDRLRYRVMEALDALFRDVDALVGPAQTGPMLVASNFTGHPCLHLRAGFVDTATRPRTTLGAAPPPPGEGPTRSVPRGVSLWGRLFDEGTILRLGLALEGALGVADRRPPGFDQ